MSTETKNMYDKKELTRLAKSVGEIISAVEKKELSYELQNPRK